MPTIQIDYDENEVRELIRADVSRRIGRDASDAEVMPNGRSDFGWTVCLAKGSADTKDFQE